MGRALRGTGLTVTGGAEPEVDVYVFVETLNADDRAALAAAVRPTVAVLAKADLAGFGGAGPMAAAARRCRELQRSVGVEVRPLAALAAVAGTDPAVLDATTVDVLQALAAGPDRVPDAARRRLAAELDLFGTAIAVAAVRAGAGRDGLSARLRAVSGLDHVCAAIDRAAAVVRYGRFAAMTETGDDAVLTRMTAAAAVMTAAGAPDVAGSARDDHLRRAIRWQRYARGPVSALHRACATDISRGALRLWARAEGGDP